MPSYDTKLIYLHAITPVHVGSGDPGGVIDLPIARDHATNWPIIPGSTLKGVLRDECPEAQQNAVFGSLEGSGKILFCDARMLFLPVRSPYGTFAYVTSPLVLNTFQGDVAALRGAPPIARDFAVPNDETALVLTGSAVSSNGKVYLEDLDIPAQDAAGEVTDQLSTFAQHLFPDNGARQASFRQRVVIVPDNIFNFLLETATQVDARNVIDDTKGTTKNLWYVESAPAESIYAGICLVAPQDASVWPFGENQAPEVIRVGGNTSVGRGLCQLRIRS